jgi:uncharacterized protein YecE (DUF72 family)
MLAFDTSGEAIVGSNDLRMVPMNSKRQSGATSPRILVGPAGWSYADWNGIVYPTHRPKDFHEAAYLSEFFDTIEINTSFYHPLKPANASQWLEQVSGNPKFLFTAKLWQKFTHEGGTGAEDVRIVREGFDILHNAGRLGAVLLQFPFSFHHTADNLARLKQILDDFEYYPLAVEVRHASWTQNSFYDLLRESGVGICNIDQPLIGRSVKPSDRATSAVGYVRLHGRRYDAWFSDDADSPPAERYNYLYSGEELQPWAERVGHVAESAQKTFVITNNHYLGKGVVNALELVRLLSNAKVRVPETLRHHYPRLEPIADEPSKEPMLFPLPPE